MDEVTEVMFRKFGFKYKKIPVPYVRDRLSYAVDKAARRADSVDPDYLKLMYGYMAAAGSSKDVPMLQNGIDRMEEPDPFLQKCVNVLSDGTGRSELLSEFEKYFKPVSEYRGYGEVSSAIMLDYPFMAFATAAFFTIMVPFMMGYMNSRRITFTTYTWFLIIGVFFVALCILRFVKILDRGLVRTRMHVAVCGCAMILYDLLMLFFRVRYVVYDVLLQNHPDFPAPKLSPLPFVVPVVLFLFYGAYSFGIRARILCKCTVSGKVSLVKKTLRATSNGKTFENISSLTAAYVVDGRRYVKTYSDGFNTAMSQKINRGDTVDIKYEKGHPEQSYIVGTSPLLSVMFILFGAVFLCGSIVAAMI